MKKENGIKCIALLRAKAGISLDEFKTRWVDEHCAFTLKMPNLKGYRVNIALSDFQDMPLEDLPYHGTAELWWENLEDMKSDFNSQEGKIAGDDADLFSEIRVHIYTAEYIMK